MKFIDKIGILLVVLNFYLFKFKFILLLLSKPTDHVDNHTECIPYSLRTYNNIRSTTTNAERERMFS